MRGRVVGLVAVLWWSGCNKTAAGPEVIGEPVPTTDGAEAVGAPPPATQKGGRTRPATPDERATIERLARAAESVRQLRFERPITIEIEDGSAVTASLRGQIDKDEIERARLLYGALGLIDPDEDLEELFSGVLGEQVIGYYDPKAGRLVVRDDVMNGLGGALGPGEIQEARLVLVHELVHALQDQRLDLADSYEQDRSIDADNAFRAVIEGDATLAMLGHALRGQGIPLSAATQGIQQMGAFLDINAFVQGEKLDDAPAILRVTLVAPYLRGLQFIASMYSVGGWASVNRAHRRPPTTSEQVLHPEKFHAHEYGEAIDMPRSQALSRAGYERIEEDTIGELELSVYLGQDRPSGTNEAAAEGWGGDRIAVLKRNAQTAVVWWTTWDTERDAIEAAAAAGRVAPPGARSIVKRSGRAVLIVRNLPQGLHPAVRRAFARFARGIRDAPPPPEVSRPRLLQERSHE